MGRLPFSFHPVLIFSYLIDALSHSFRTYCSNFPTPIVVDQRGYFGSASCATDMLISWKSTPIKPTTVDFTKVELLKTADLVAP